MLFVPPFALMLLVAFVVGQAWWFGLAALPALLLNAVIIIVRPSRDWVWRWVSSIAGTDARLHR